MLMHVGFTELKYKEYVIKIIFPKVKETKLVNIQS
jgi:hypothetical protein